MTKLFLDTETRSSTDIRMGAYRYSEDPTFEVQLTAWSWDGAPAQVTEGVPSEVVEFLLHGDGPILAHNSGFDRVALSEHLRRQGLLGDHEYLDPARWVEDTMFRARVYGFPGSLKNLAKALGAEEKDEAGTRLIRKFAVPPFCAPWKAPDDWAAYMLYCRQDVATLVDIDRRLPAMPEMERRVAYATERMNDRGIAVDVEAVAVLHSQYVQTCERNLERMREITGLENPNSQKQQCDWLSERLGEPVKSVAKAVVADMLRRPDLGEDVAEFLRLKQYNGLATAKKFRAILDRVCSDGRLRGETQYMGAANTGRFSSRGTQLQNLSHDDQTVVGWEAMLSDVLLGRELSAEELRSMIRPLFTGPFVDDDYGQIEARLLAWCAGEETVLEHFREGRDLYTETAKEMGPQFRRAEGKVAVLACLSPDTRVLTRRGWVPIVLVSPGDEVWDGVEWVTTDGAVYRGERRVMACGPLACTPDHRVWTTLLEQPVRADTAAKLRAPLASPRPGGPAVRTVGDHRTRPAVAKRLGEPVRPLPVPRVRIVRLGGKTQPRKRGKHAVQLVQRVQRRTSVAGATVYGAAAAVREPKSSRVQGLRCARNPVRVSVSPSRRRVGNVGTGPRPGQAARPHRQRPWLRTRKYPLGLRSPEHSEQAVLGTTRGLGVPRVRVAVLQVGSREVPARRPVKAGYHRPGRASRRRQAHELAGYSAPTPVYDLLNCGPRSRFVADGALVHNCGYAGGANALKNFGGEAMVPEGEDVDAYLWGMVNAWRDSHPKTVRLWQQLMDDFVSGTGWFEAPEPGVRALRLPSGRRLYYRDVRRGWDDVYDRPEYTCTEPGGRHPGQRRKVTKNTLSNNLIQATARDLMALALVRAEERGLRPVVLVHDEMIVEGGEAEAEAVRECMETLPDWAEGLPLVAAPELMARWVKV